MGEDWEEGEGGREQGRREETRRREGREIRRERRERSEEDTRDRLVSLSLEKKLSEKVYHLS